MKIRWSLVSACMYVVSLVLPAVVVTGGPLFGPTRPEVVFGMQCLLYGWFAITAWLANVVLFFAAIALHCKRPGLARFFAIVAVGLALTSFAYGPELRHMHVGFYVWVGSMLALALATRSSEPPAQGRDEAI